MSNNTHLPAEVTDKIKKEASFYSGHNPDEDSTPFRNGYYSGYISGATEYATKLHTLQVEFNNIRKANDKWEQAFNMAQRGYDAAYNDLEKLKQKFDEMKEKYDNILATEDGHLSQTENVWQSGYAAGHEAGYEKANHKVRNELQKQFIENDIKWVKENNALKGRCDKMEAALRWSIFHAKECQKKYNEPAGNLIDACNDGLAWKGKEDESVVGKCIKCGRHYPHKKGNNICNRCEAKTQ